MSYVLVPHAHAIYRLDDTEAEHLTSGTCPSGNQFTVHECRKLAIKNGWSRTTSGGPNAGPNGEYNADWMPSGCIYTGSAHVTFNMKDTETPCSTSYNCLCKTKRKGNIIDFFPHHTNFT